MAGLESIGKYDVRREIGHGAMGVVYEGYDPAIKRVVALKTIRADQLTGEDPAGVIARFRREAQAAGRLNHPNIVSIYDFGEDDGIWYIAMEHVHGRELKECFETNERFKITDIVRIMTQMLNALDYSHRQGVIHRDIKPANIFLLPDGSVKVADFGIAHIETSNLTQVGTVLGTPSYMSPEQIMGLPVDGRSDLFSAGVVLYQLLTGERPFTGSSTTTMQKVLRETPLPPSALNVQLLPAMDAVVQKALSKNADQRYQSAQELADAIRAAASTGFAPLASTSAYTQASAPIGNSDPTLITASPPMASPTQSMAVAASTAAVMTSTAPAQQSASNGSSVAPAIAARSGSVDTMGTQPSQPGTSTPPPSGNSHGLAVAIVVAAAVVVVGSGAWFMYSRQASQPVVAQSPSTPAAAVPGWSSPSASSPASSPANAAAAAATASSTVSSTAGASAAPAAAPASSAPTTPAGKAEAGTVMISAVGLIDPSDPRYSSDKALLQSDLRADSKSQLVEKAVGLLVDNASVAKHYDLLRDRLLAKSGDYINTVVRESEPRVGKDGLMSITTDAVVNVKAVQKSLNQMSRDERIDFIRASGDPKVSVQILARDADLREVPAQTSAVADNILKERIKSFGFRTWSEGAGGEPGKGADFAVIGEAAVKKLSMKLPASGLTVNKYALTSWTVKCIDRQTGEEIYYNTTLPKGLGSWASEEEALKAIGGRIADEFSRDFFLQHANVTGQPVALAVSGMPHAAAEELLARELVGLPEVISVAPRLAGNPRVFDLQLAGSGSPGDRVAEGILKPLNAKLGQACFTLGAINGSQVAVAFDARCVDATVLGRLESNPPAGLYGAPPGRQKTVTRNPETLRKLSI